MSRKVTDYEIGSRDDGRTTKLADFVYGNIWTYSDESTRSGCSLIFGVFSGIFNIIFLIILIKVFTMLELPNHTTVEPNRLLRSKQ